MSGKTKGIFYHKNTASTFKDLAKKQPQLPVPKKTPR